VGRFRCLLRIPVLRSTPPRISTAERPRTSPCHPQYLQIAWYILGLIWSSRGGPSTESSANASFLPQLTHRNETRHQWVFASVIEDSLLAPEEHGATVSNFTEGLRPTTGAGQQHHAGHCRTVRREQLGRGRRGRRVPGEGDRGVYQQAHAFLVVLTLGKEVQPFA